MYVKQGVLENGEVIAVKKLERTSGIHARRFQNEANNLLELEHKNVVKLIGSCCQAERQVVEHDGKYVFTDVVEKLLCYEYLPNGSLDNYIYGNTIRHKLIVIDLYLLFLASWVKISVPLYFINIFI